jgi:hypothetical protein
MKSAIISSGGSSIRCRVLNLSPDRAAVERPDTRYVPEGFQLMTESNRVIRYCSIAWMMTNSIGVESTN